MAKIMRRMSKESRSGEVTDFLVKPHQKINASVALRLRIQDRLTYKEIAARFGCTEDAVRQRLARFLYLCDNPGDLEAYRQQKQNVFDTLEHAIITRLWREVEQGRASVGDLARGLDTVSKQVRLFAGQSTNNISLLVQTLTDLHKDVDGALRATRTNETA